MFEKGVLRFSAYQEGREQAPVFGQTPALGGCLRGVSGLQVTGTQPIQQSGLSCKQRWDFFVGTEGVSPGDPHVSRIEFWVQSK
jgi:hypothetical protein